MRDMDIFHTISGQCDPTAGKALSNLIREENRALRQKEKKLQDLTASRKHFTPAATAEPYKELANAMIALAYSDYVDVLRTLEAIPEPAPTADEKIVAKHQNRIDQLKAEMDSALTNAELISKAVNHYCDFEYYYIECELYCIEDIAEHVEFEVTEE